jgi:hypothetical protein
MSSHITVILLCSKENKTDANREKFVSVAFSSANPYDVQAKVKLPWISNFMFKSFINLKMIFLHPIFVNEGLTWALKQSVACMMLRLDVLIYC